MLSGICSAGVSRVCTGAGRGLCRACPLYSKFAGQDAPQFTPDIEDLGLGGIATTTRRLAARRRRALNDAASKVIAVDSTTEFKTHSTTTIKLSTTMGLETDGPPDFKVPQGLRLKTQRRMMSSTAASLQRTTHASRGRPLRLAAAQSDDDDDVRVAPRGATATAAAAPAVVREEQAATKIVSFSSTEGKQMFRESMVEGYQESYFRLSEQFSTQCDGGSGVGSLAMVLNALQVDPLQSDVVDTPVWKGIWRWFSSDMLAKRAGSTGCASGGATKGDHPRKPPHELTEFACLARRALSNDKDRTVASFLTCHTDITAFRIHVKYSVSSPNTFLIACFDRNNIREGVAAAGSASLEYSPIAGYHAASDSVLILDVDREKSTPYWVPLSRLYGNMREGGYCIFRKEAADEAEDRRDIARLLDTLRDSVSGDKHLTAALTVQQDLARDPELREVLSSSRTYTQIVSTATQQNKQYDDALMPVLVALLLATPSDILMQALPERQQASLWWMKRSDVQRLHTWLPKWSKQLAWLQPNTCTSPAPNTPTPQHYEPTCYPITVEG